MVLTIGVRTGYDADPDHIERVLLEEVRGATGKVPGLLADPPPAVLLVPGLGESSLNFTLVCQVRGFEDQGGVQHELHKRILRRFRAEGIDIPFPQQTLHVVGGSPPAPAGDGGKTRQESA
jgi:small-conductance mechanosensitive channel